MSRGLDKNGRKNYRKAALKIFLDVLDISDISPKDGFFELGGTSLSAAIAASRIEEELGIEFPVREFFSNPNIRHLVDIVDRNGSAEPTRSE